jgi:uncharacterized protein (DUF1800 family)
MAEFSWSATPGKFYTLESTTDLGVETWQTVGSYAPVRLTDLKYNTGYNSGGLFFRVRSGVYDTDDDGLEDWEELLVGFDPENERTGRWYEDDDRRLREVLSSPSIVSIGVLDGKAREDWPDSAVIAVRRSGGVRAISVPLSWSGTAGPASDYIGQVSQVDFAVGQNEVLIEINALDDGLTEDDEIIQVQALQGEGYFASSLLAHITVEDRSPNGLPGEVEAARFLEQATFGPVSEDVASVREMGMSAWIEAQFQAEVNHLMPVIDAWEAAGNNIGSSSKMLAWWERAMNGTDPLRQKMAYALSQIFVISDADGGLAGQPRGMVHYYDMLLDHSFGNYRDLLLDITLNPTMGRYLSHVQNMAADPRTGLFPDENYAREIMQLFSIGLWELNPDGSRKLDTSGDPIPTYDIDDIGEFARIFTGLNYEGNNDSQWWRFLYPKSNYLEPMRMWNGPYDVWNDETESYDEVWFHDPGEKRLLRGKVVPANQRGEKDIEDAIDNLFNHPNVGPFIGLRLIQRLVTSNPTPGYIARVSAAFDDNGEGVRGDLKAVLRAILLDPEARSAELAMSPEFGKVHEPYLRLVKLARAFKATSPSGWYAITDLQNDYGMQPLRSPTVFNFFQPDYQPNGEIKEHGLVSPELQIVNEVYMFSVKNHLYRASYDYFNRYSNNRAYDVKADLGEALTHAHDADALVSFLDRKINGSRSTPEELAAISYSLNRIAPTEAMNRVETAVYLISTTATASVQR